MLLYTDVLVPYFTAGLISIVYNVLLFLLILWTVGMLLCTDVLVPYFTTGLISIVYSVLPVLLFFGL